ncbi:MAG: argininosuccinate lyase [Planctomycetota bacterium]|nr:MAG: argininosuccinate lyase [Planctomycetota bacterium]
MSLWGGRFEGGLAPAFESFNRSLPFDKRLWREDIEGSIAWAKAHESAQTLTRKEAQSIIRALQALEKRLSLDDSELASSGAEDIHSFVEAALVAEIGDLGKKLHTGRSRNDQVATDLRLWCKKRGKNLLALLAELMDALSVLAEREAATPLPGYTHLQRAQVITVGHHALAYVEMLWRDQKRLEDALKRLDECPLGSGAIAGTGFPIERRQLASDLGFDRITRNSLDAVSDRDFVAELLFVATLSGAHLSRFAEDWIFYASQEAGFLKLADDVSTGSSLMPQKKNPDSLELIRGKGARLLGRLTGFLACLRSLPLAYNKDLQEDKEALFEAIDTWEACLTVTRLCVQGAEFDAEACRRACTRGYLDATDLADYLVKKGLPFREAHDLVGILVRSAIERDCELGALPLELMQELAPVIEEDVYAAIDLERCLSARTAKGSTSPRLVRQEARRWRKRL